MKSLSINIKQNTSAFSRNTQKYVKYVSMMKNGVFEAVIS